jgi:hypothetical protein
MDCGMVSLLIGEVLTQEPFASTFFFLSCILPSFFGFQNIQQSAMLTQFTAFFFAV